MTTISQSLKEIIGFSNKFVVYNLVLRNLKIRYRKSYLGIFWTTLIPAFTGIVYYFVFQFVLKVELPFYPFFILSGLMSWTFVAASLFQGLESIVGNHHILNKVPIPFFVFPLAENISAFINLVLGIPVLVIVALILRVPFTPLWLLYPFLLMALFLMCYFASLTLSICFVYLRDLRQILSVVLQGWFYATPIVYELNMIPERFQWTLLLNPVGSVFHSIHLVLIYGKMIPLINVLSMLFWVTVLMVLAAYIYSKNKRFLIEKI